MERYFRQPNACCGGQDFLVVEGDAIIRGFCPNCLGLVEYAPEDAPGGLPGLADSAQEITQAQYQAELVNVGL